VREPAPELANGHGAVAGNAPLLWRTAREPRVRDLAWCTLSPPLLSRLPEAGVALAQWPSGSRAAWERWLATADPATLPPTIDELAHGRADDASLSLRLGRHAERLLQFALQHADGVELLAANLPVRRAGERGIQTLGELDFVWRDLATGAIVHWEMAAKFYLYAGGGTEGLHGFVGPNLVDRLADKLAHLIHRQLPLGHAPEARALLGREVDRSEVYLLGWLFFRNGEAPPGLAALGIADDHLRGWWSSLEDWRARAAEGGRTRWCRLSRASWLSPAVMPERETEHADALHAALARRFADPGLDKGWRRESPVMLCELEPAGAGLWRERSRGFVVPPGWEERAGDRAAGAVGRAPR